jgi:hypothetical protein
MKIKERYLWLGAILITVGLCFVASMNDAKNRKE